MLESDHAKLPIGFTGHETGGRARLETDGLCSLVLHTPDFAESAGRTRSLSATFRNIDELYE